MNRTITKLKQTWQKEKSFYRKPEVGTGVQGFVKKIFETLFSFFNLNV